MENVFRIPQLYLRLALGIGFTIPVADRMGWLGSPKDKAISWGNWDNFVAYTNALLPFLNRSAAEVMGFLATLAEIFIGVMLVIGYKTRIAAYDGFALTLIFALCMAVFLGIKAPFTYSVFADSAGSLLLASVPHYKWSLDDYFSQDTSSSFY